MESKTMSITPAERQAVGNQQKNSELRCVCVCVCVCWLVRTMSPVCEADGAVCAEAKAQAAKLRKHGTTRNWNITACKAVSRMCILYRKRKAGEPRRGGT